MVRSYFLEYECSAFLKYIFLFLEKGDVDIGSLQTKQKKRKKKAGQFYCISYPDIFIFCERKILSTLLSLVN